MHQLVTILAKKGKQFYKKDVIAKAFCDRYVGMTADGLFDWADTETTGRWEDLYPDNLLEGDDVIGRLEDVMKYQHQRIEEISEEIDGIIGSGTMDSPEKSDAEALLWVLLQMKADQKLGQFTSTNSDFLYMENDSGTVTVQTGTVTPQLIAEVRKSPDDYCILLVNAHF